MDEKGGGGKRKIEEQVELAKQKAQAIAARLLNTAPNPNPNPNPTTNPDYDYEDSYSKRPRTLLHSPPPNDPSSHPSYPVSYTQNNGNSGSKKIIIPNAKVGVIIGRGGDMIKNLQLESGARIQITRDAEANPNSLTRDVELMGTQEQIARAEERINQVIAESDTTSSTPSGNRGPPPPAGGEQFVMKVPNDKVALVIGKGGETIKTMQSKTGARIQVVPLRLPPGDTSTERNLYINGTQEQIDAAKELVNEVISGNRLKVLSDTTTYQQHGYPPSSGWAPQGQPPAQQPPAYGYSQPGNYGVAPPPYYGGYPPQSTAWDQSGVQTQQQNTGYNSYGQAQPPSSTAPNVNYNYGQMPPAAGYNYNQGYPQQPPSYGQDVSGQTAPDQANAYPNYGPPLASSQPDESAAIQTSQPGYATPAASGQPDGTGQSQVQSYASGYSQPSAAPNGYSAYPSYSSAPPVQPTYNQTGYSQAGYGQQSDGQAASQASYSYYGQSGYPPSQAPAQAGYYQSSYPSAIPPPQGHPQPTNGTSNYADGGNTTVGSGAAGEGSEKPQS